MDPLERVLKERVDELADEVAARVGLSPHEAKRFVEQAGFDLMASYRWQAADLSSAEMASPGVVRDLLAGISGRAVADRVGLSPGRTWDGLRALVPAVLESVARCDAADLPVDGPRPTPNGSGSRGDTDRRFDIGFGLFFEQGGGDDASGSPRPRSFRHPIFDRLFPVPGRQRQ